MGENNYPNGTTLNPEQISRIKRKETRELKKLTKKNKTIRLANEAQNRVTRDNKLDEINSVLKRIKTIMVCYNKAGKVERDATNILYDIRDLIDEVEISDEDIKAEVFDEDEVSQKIIEDEIFEEPNNHLN